MATSKARSVVSDKDALRERVTRLGLHGLVGRWSELCGESWIENLLEIEEKERARRSLERRVRNAKIGRFKPLCDFEWSWPRKIDRELVEDLFRLDFLGEAANVVLIGPNGVGKTTIAQNLAHEALIRGATVRFAPASAMLAELSSADGPSALERRLRRYLHALGYHTHRWGLGQNLGLRDGVGGRLLHRLEALHARHGRAVSLVGWSLGGVYARELAKLAPARVRQVVTLGSPFGMQRRADGTGWLAGMVFGAPGGGANEGRIADPPPVPVTAIVSRSDAIAGFHACREAPAEQAENIEVMGSHIGLGLNPLVLFAIADRLAQRENAWRNFDRSGLRGVLYG